MKITSTIKGVTYTNVRYEADTHKTYADISAPNGHKRHHRDGYDWECPACHAKHGIQGILRHLEACAKQNGIDGVHDYGARAIAQEQRRMIRLLRIFKRSQQKP